MFNSFPQPKQDSGGGKPWIGDWSAYSTVHDLSPLTITSVPANSWATLLDVVGTGWLAFARGAISVSATNPHVEVSVDGKTYQFDGAGTQSNGGNLLYQPIFFSSRLTIRIFNASASAANLTLDYTYLLKTGTPNPTKQTVLDSSQRKMAYLNTSSTSLVDVVNITGSGYLLAVEFLPLYISAAGPTFGHIVIDGVTKMNSRTLHDINTANVKQPLFLGPIRFLSSLQVQTKVGAAGMGSLCKVSYTLD